MAALFDGTLKMLIVGDSGVGKTSLMMRFVDETFSNSFITTIGIDFKLRMVEMPDADSKQTKKIRLQIWDTAGQERFRSITKAYLKGADAVMLVYDVTDEESFLHVRHWITVIHNEVLKEDTLGLLLVANKSDLSRDRVVETKRGEQLAKEYNIPFLETSARSEVGVEDAFMQLAKLTYERKGSAGEFEDGILKKRRESTEAVSCGSCTIL
jgi:small GTP-binding protein